MAEISPKRETMSTEREIKRDVLESAQKPPIRSQTGLQQVVSQGNALEIQTNERVDVFFTQRAQTRNVRAHENSLYAKEVFPNVQSPRPLFGLHRAPQARKQNVRIRRDVSGQSLDRKGSQIARVRQSSIGPNVLLEVETRAT